MLHGWHTRLGHESVIVFAHGNGFCGRVYQPLHELLAQRYDLLLLDLPGHGNSPQSEFVGWNKTAEHLHQCIVQSQDVIAGRDVHSVAHSLGGMLSMLVASTHPTTFKSMVMLDPIMFPQPLLAVMQVVSKLGLTKQFHPFVKPTLRRRNGWQSTQQAFDYFHNRKIFKDWTDASLQSYVDHALKLVDSEVVLCCDPKIEAQWFATLPSGLWSAVAGLQLPVRILMGQDTYPFSLRAGRHAQKCNANIDFSIVLGGHCFMQEHPQSTADAVITTFANYGST